MKTKDIFLANVQYGMANYPRPVVIIEVCKNSAIVGLISSAIDLYNPVYDFLILPDNPEFPATGLDCKSIIKGYPFPELDSKKFIRQLGCLTGSLADDFDKWLGK